MREIVWIIGASDGIGAALARAYAARGAHLVLSARSEDALEKLKTEIDESGSSAEVHPLDVADRASLETAVEGLADVTRVIHLAAIYDPGKVADIDPEMAAKIVTVNLTGTLNVAQITPKALRKGGQLALCGSVAGYMGLPQGQIYSATKAGVINLAESLRVEARDQLDVRLISPGFVDTRLTKKNDFTMPALVTPEVAAAAIVKGLDGRRFEVHFPRRLTLALKLLRALPYGLSLPLTRRLVT